MSLLTDSLLYIILQELVIILCLSQKLLNSSKNSASWAFCLERSESVSVCVFSSASVDACPDHPTPTLLLPQRLGLWGTWMLKSAHSTLTGRGLRCVGQLKCVWGDDPGWAKTGKSQ